MACGVSLDPGGRRLVCDLPNAFEIAPATRN